MNKTLLAIATAALLSVAAIGAIIPSAFADGAIAPDGSNWGSATQDFAPLGEHASSFDEPRLGLGNLAQLFGSWCGLLAFLGFPCS
ncbi:MAG: hypothetical protein MN733_11640 [Nitrososphaera sp.]|nr:hypothetical protein [Nitrososphaera sp.]